MASLEININQTKADFQAIKASLINNGVEVPDGTRTAEYADKINEIYENGLANGKQSQYDEIWDVIQDYGKRTIYMRGFSRWGGEILSPKYKVIPTGNCSALFNGSKIKHIDKEKFDLSQATYVSNGSGSTTYCICEYCNNLEVFPDINLQAGYYANAFNDCFRLHTIEVLRVAKDTVFGTAFRSCEALKNITIEGEIGNSFDIHWSTLLTRESIESIITALTSDNTTAKLTLSKTAVINAFGSNYSDQDSTWMKLVTPKTSVGWTINLS
jgi:hypothetical protein